MCSHRIFTMTLPFVSPPPQFLAALNVFGHQVSVVPAWRVDAGAGDAKGLTVGCPPMLPWVLAATSLAMVRWWMMSRSSSGVSGCGRV
jgi:hypothetical protein